MPISTEARTQIKWYGNALFAAELGTEPLDYDTGVDDSGREFVVAWFAQVAEDVEYGREPFSILSMEERYAPSDPMEAPAGTPMTRADAEWLEHFLSEEGLPGADLTDPSTYELTTGLWEHAYMGLDAVLDVPFKRRAVARRVLAAWLALYVPADDVDEEDLIDAR